MTTIREMQRLVHANAVSKGFHDGATRSNAEISMKLALIHSEVSEALEDLRESGLTTESGRTNTGKPVGFPSELADVVIRVFDLAELLGIDLQREIEIKHAYNTTRPPMHGKNF